MTSVQERWRVLQAELGTRNARFWIAALLERITGGHGQLIRWCIVAQPVPATQPALASGRQELRWLDRDDPLVARLQRPHGVLARRFAAGDRCLSIWQDGTLAGALWLAEGRYEEDEVRCRFVFPPDCFDVNVEPQFRLGRSFARLWHAANEDLRSRGLRWSLSRISCFNAGSMAAHRRLGARSVGYATFIVLGALQIAWLPRRWPLSVSISGTPVLRLRAP